MDRADNDNPIILVERDHKILMNRWRTLTTALQRSTDRGHVRECIRGLIACAREHFRNEEWAMRVTACPGYLKHKRDHARLLNEAEDMLRNFDTAFSRTDWPALAAYFRHWISRHNEKYDKMLHSFVRQSHVGA